MKATDNRLMGFDGKHFKFPIGVSYLDSELPEINRQNIEFMVRFRIEWDFDENGFAMPKKLINPNWDNFTMIPLPNETI